MADMKDLVVTQQVGSGRMAPVLAWGGVLLLLAGTLLVYPYAYARVPIFPATPVSPPQTPHPVTALPTAARTPHTTTLASTPIPTPTSPPIPLLIPTPALPIRIVIPAIKLDAPIIPVSWRMVEVDGQEQAVWDLPKIRAAGWHSTSAPPGMIGNMVLSGHNKTVGEVFRYLYLLEVGDIISVYTADGSYTYAVTQTHILPEAGQPMDVRIENASYIMPTEDERLTLVTCHPYGSLRNRLIVIAHPVESQRDIRRWSH